MIIVRSLRFHIGAVNGYGTSGAQGLSASGGDTAYLSGVVLLALIMVIYGTFWGIRAIAWTDALQGTILFFGFAFLLFLMVDRFGPLENATRILMERDSILGTTFTTRPDADACRTWLSYILAVGFGVSLYPQAIQRIYAKICDCFEKSQL